jgi:hypothetical protein
MSTYQDPSFREAHRELARVVPEAIVEWLRRRGEFTMPAVKPKTWRRWLRERALIPLPIAMFIGLVLGWVLRMMWLG